MNGRLLPLHALRGVLYALALAVLLLALGLFGAMGGFLLVPPLVLLAGGLVMVARRLGYAGADADHAPVGRGRSGRRRSGTRAGVHDARTAGHHDRKGTVTT